MKPDSLIGFKTGRMGESRDCCTDPTDLQRLKFHNLHGPWAHGALLGLVQTKLVPVTYQPKAVKD